MSNVDTTKQAYELFSQGKISELIDLCSDQCKWVLPGPKDVLPWAGTWQGKQGVGAFFAALGDSLTFQDFHWNNMVEQGDTVIVFGSGTATSKKTGKVDKDNEWVHVFRYDDDGKLVFFQEYIDTAAAVVSMTPEMATA